MTERERERDTNDKHKIKSEFKTRRRYSKNHAVCGVADILAICRSKEADEDDNEMKMLVFFVVG